MNRQETVFDYLKQIAVIYGFTVLALIIFCLLFGENAKEYSTIFALGSRGLSLSTLLQFFLLSVLIATLRFVLFTDGLIRRVPIALRTLLMFSSVIVVIVLFNYWFGWFPINMWQPWVMFFLCFGICAGVSTLLTTWKERLEDEAMAKALERMKQEAAKNEQHN